MPENASTINVHHYFETSAHIYFIIMACCIALVAIVVLILLIIVSIALCVLIRFKRGSHKRLRSRRESLKTQEERLSHSIAGVSSCINNPASMERDFGLECNSNIQSIPLSTFKGPEDTFGNSSESSAGLYDVLFPSQHEEEIIYELPNKLVDFPGQVFASTRKNSKADLNLGPSVSGLNADSVSGSLEWDYFQTKSCNESASPEMESETRREQIVDVCWV